MNVVRVLTLAAIALAGAQASSLAGDGGRSRGETVYRANCAACHDPGPGHPGTQMLAAKKGKELSVLVGRSDLGEDTVRAVVRNGLVEMPPFRPSEVSDHDIKALVKFIHQNEEGR